MTTIHDVLRGRDTVRIETTEAVYTFPVKNSTIQINQLSVPEEVVEATRDNFPDYEVVECDQVEFSMSIHDEPKWNDRHKVANETGYDKDSSIVDSIAHIGYEIELTVEVDEAEGEWRVTHLNGHELVEPITREFEPSHTDLL